MTITEKLAELGEKIANDDAQAAGEFADICRLQLERDYAATFERVRREVPQITLQSWDCLLAESDRP